MTKTIHLDCYARTDCKPEVLSGVETGNRIPHDERNLRGIAHCALGCVILFENPNFNFGI